MRRSYVLRMANGTLLSGPPVEVSAPTPLPAVLSTFRALRHRNYRLFFVGQAVSLVGTWVQITALMWLAYELTGTSRWPSLVAAAQLLPAFLLDRKSTRLNSSHLGISYAVFCL